MKKINEDIKISASDFSKHLFWDIDSKNLDFNKHKKWLVGRVLQYGLMKDWELLCKQFSLDEIVTEALEIRDLDEKSASFLSILSGIPIEKFLCYTIKQSHPPHWNF